MITTGTIPKDPSYYETLPKSSYAVNYTVHALGIELVLIGGFSSCRADPIHERSPEKYVPEIKAGSVKDRYTLKNFVEKTVEFVDHAYKATRGNMDIAELLRVSSGKEAWKHNEIYLLRHYKPGLVVFNGNNPNFSQASTINVVDENGVNIGERIIKVAESGGGFVHYLWDNPLIEGDEITEVGKAKGTLSKISYCKANKARGWTPTFSGRAFTRRKDSQYATDMKTESKVYVQSLLDV